ncbi:MAG: choice-of-anchor L domain-containing protein, partial [Bacteroidota bacterium]|nr:choice-of-anchor L domain-containing protein [Bacteroidota bacterium]
MKKQAIIYSIIICLLTAFNVVFAQSSDSNTDVLSTDPSNPEIMLTSDELVFNEYTLFPSENIELPVEDALRMYYPQNYYAQFIMPANHDIHAFIKYPNQDGLTAGLAAYTFNGEGYSIVKQTHISESPGLFRIRQSDFEAGEEVILRVWFSQDMTNETIQLAVRKHEPTSQPKLISVDQSTYTPQQLVQDVLISGCLEAENVVYTGDPISIGYFTGAIGSSGFDEGIILCSGDATLAEGPDVGTSTGAMTSGGSDPDLELILGPLYDVNDAAILEFDFIPASDTLKFEYIFGSEEFHEFANSSFNDAFGFFLSGPGISGPYTDDAINIALLPNGQPVTIDNVYNSGIYYTGSTDANTSLLSYDNDIEYDGASIPLVAEAEVQMCETYHIKLAIGDAGDSSYDSGVFFKAGSFTSGLMYEVSAFNPWYSTDEMYEGCTTLIVFNRINDTTNIDDPILIPLNVTGDADMNVDYSSIPDT